MQENKKPVVEVLSIADDLEITSIFRHRTWKVKEGIDCLVGIFQENKLPDGAFELLTLDGRRYSSVQHKSEFDDLNKRSKVLEELWDSTGRIKDRYKPRVFLEWGMENRDISNISWYDDAFAKGLLNKILNPPPVKQEEKLTSSERQKLLVIIAGILKENYKYSEHGILKKLRVHIEKAGLGISENALSKHFHAAVSLLGPADKENASKPH